ncbi:MAG TPA: septal ring lytic transglycosylase RlpA family protein [Agriterribacter sp.]|nr:septal ring lytic transglycosylase RlpA family protein [Agriterribacter sp.]
MKQLLVLLFSFFYMGLWAGGLQAQNKSSNNASSVKQGTASFYADKFKGRVMANGKKYDPNKLTAASNRYDLGTWVKVKNLSNKKTVVVQITDRMHPGNKRLIDLSKAAAKKLGFISKGVTKVEIEIVKRP